MMRRESPWPSLRELASAAGVSVPTLRHYFGGRPQVVDAIFEECLKLRRAGLDAVRHSEKPFEASIREYCETSINALRAEGDVPLGNLYAVALGEGLLDNGVSRSTLRHIIDPTIEGLEERLSHHVARGEMIQTDLRAAALMLIAPLLVAAFHQDQLNGESDHPMSLERTAEAVSAAFVRAYRTSGQPKDEPSDRGPASAAAATIA